MDDPTKDPNAQADQAADQAGQTATDTAGAGDGQPTGGPSDDQKMQRLEREAKEAKEAAERERDARLALEKKASEARRNSMSEEDRYKEDKKEFYKDVARKSVVGEFSEKISKLNPGLKERIEKDPFKFIDQDVLELELLRVDRENPQQVWEAAERAAKKSLPEFLDSLGASTVAADDGDGGNGVGNNPAIAEGDPIVPKDKSSLFQMPYDELKKLKNQLTDK